MDTIVPSAAVVPNLLGLHADILVVDPAVLTFLVGVGRDGGAGACGRERIVALLPPAAVEDELAELVGGILVVDAERFVLIVTNAGELGVGSGFEVVADAESTIVPASSSSSFIDALWIT
jgi:hypothetical protein